MCLDMRAQGENGRKQLESCQCKGLIFPHFRVGILLLWIITSCPKFKPLARPSLWNHEYMLKATLGHGRWEIWPVNCWVWDSRYTPEMLREALQWKYSFPLTSGEWRVGERTKEKLTGKRPQDECLLCYRLQKLWETRGWCGWPRSSQKSSSELHSSYCDLVASYTYLYSVSGNLPLYRISQYIVCARKSVETSF